MLQPKKTKFRRMQKGRMKGIAQRGNQLAYGSFAIKALDSAWITYRQMLEACLKNVEEQGLIDSEAYRSIQEKFQVLSLAPQRYETKKQAIVLAANYAYVDQVLTTIKSIVFHHRNIRFYLINDDFSQEWFRGLNRHLAALSRNRIDQLKIRCDNRCKKQCSRQHLPVKPQKSQDSILQ